MRSKSKFVGGKSDSGLNRRRKETDNHKLQVVKHFYSDDYRMTPESGSSESSILTRSPKTLSEGETSCDEGFCCSRETCLRNSSKKTRGKNKKPNISSRERRKDDYSNKQNYKLDSRVKYGEKSVERSSDGSEENDSEEFCSNDRTKTSSFRTPNSPSRGRKNDFAESKNLEPHRKPSRNKYLVQYGSNLESEHQDQRREKEALKGPTLHSRKERWQKRSPQLDEELTRKRDVGGKEFDRRGCRTNVKGPPSGAGVPGTPGAGPISLSRVTESIVAKLHGKFNRKEQGRPRHSRNGRESTIHLEDFEPLTTNGKPGKRRNQMTSHRNTGRRLAENDEFFEMTNTSNEQLKQIKNLQDEIERLRSSQCENTAAAAAVPTKVVEVKQNDVQWRPGDVLGEGTFATVYKGLFCGTEVAVKELKRKLSQDDQNYFRSEAELLQQLHHPRVVLLMGACTSALRPFMILEYMSGGSLYSLIHERTMKPLEQAVFFSIAKDVALGVNFLHKHDPQILHLDLKSMNVLLDAHSRAKIADFGFSILRRTRDTTVQGGIIRGTPAWMAPELLTSGKVSPKCDVYSYGIILWEMLTASKPFEGFDIEGIVEAVRNRERPKIPSRRTSHELRELVSSCWSQNASLRPGFEEILRALDTANTVAVSPKQKMIHKNDLNSSAQLPKFATARDLLSFIKESADLLEHFEAKNRRQNRHRTPRSKSFRDTNLDRESCFKVIRRTTQLDNLHRNDRKESPREVHHKARHQSQGKHHKERSSGARAIARSKSFSSCEREIESRYINGRTRGNNRTSRNPDQTFQRRNALTRCGNERERVGHAYSSFIIQNIVSRQKTAPRGRTHDDRTPERSEQGSCSSTEDSVEDCRTDDFNEEQWETELNGEQSGFNRNPSYLRRGHRRGLSPNRKGFSPKPKEILPVTEALKGPRIKGMLVTAAELVKQKKRLRPVKQIDDLSDLSRLGHQNSLNHDISLILKQAIAQRRDVLEQANGPIDSFTSQNFSWSEAY